MRGGGAAAGRRPAYPRHEVRFGGRELALGAVGLGLVCALAFAGGLLVGRGLGPGPGPADPGRSPGPVEARPPPGPPGGPEAPRSAAARAEESLTFYRTLTAPTVDLPGTEAPPVVEERLVPREEAAPPPTKTVAGPGPEHRAAAGPRAEPAPRPRAVPPPAPPVPAAAHGAGPVPPEPQMWTVQVSSFRSRTLADDLRARLTARGFDAYLVSVATEEGRVRYRVRVGTYGSRVEADRVAGELRSERGLSPFVTPKSR